jgi:hypothetical protein
MGGKKPVLIRYITALGTVDEDVADNLLGKLAPVVEQVDDTELDTMEAEFRPRDIGTLLERMRAIADARRADVATSTEGPKAGSSATPTHGHSEDPDDFILLEI